MSAQTRITTAWRSPSNIAIIKYWGKHGIQMPDNPSVSITLSVAATKTHLAFEPDGTQRFAFSFHGKEVPEFADRIRKFLQQVAPELLQGHLEIASTNTFPHSSGIASSASAMSALALCIADVRTQTGHMDAHDRRAVSNLARLGSGSACRSVYGPICLWGNTEALEGSSDEYATPVMGVHPVFTGMRDSILIIDDAAKAVSSSAGHALMEGHLFRKGRLAQANRHLQILLPALRNGDLETFGAVAEAEALSLHALMMTSSPSFILMKPNTLVVLECVRKFRADSGVPVYFSLDAGPNVHLLYPGKHQAVVRQWIDDELAAFCQEDRIIHDEAGEGPVAIPNEEFE
jgi:diphosphomevalonate decarboxylase